MPLLLWIACGPPSWDDTFASECHDYTRTPVGADEDPGLGFSAEQVMEVLGHVWHYALAWDSRLGPREETLRVDLVATPALHLVEAGQFVCVESHPLQGGDRASGGTEGAFLEIQARTSITTSDGDLGDPEARVQADAEGADPALVWLWAELGAEGWSPALLAAYRADFRPEDSEGCEPGTRLRGGFTEFALELGERCPAKQAGNGPRLIEWRTATATLVAPGE